MCRGEEGRGRKRKTEGGSNGREGETAPWSPLLSESRGQERDEGRDVPDLSSLCESHLRHSSGMVFSDVTEY